MMQPSNVQLQASDKLRIDRVRRAHTKLIDKMLVSDQFGPSELFGVEKYRLGWTSPLLQPTRASFGVLPSYGTAQCGARATRPSACDAEARSRSAAREKAHELTALAPHAAGFFCLGYER
jgi:hypothetical protein